MRRPAKIALAAALGATLAAGAISAWWFHGMSPERLDPTRRVEVAPSRKMLIDMVSQASFPRHFLIPSGKRWLVGRVFGLGGRPMKGVFVRAGTRAGLAADRVDFFGDGPSLTDEHGSYELEVDGGGVVRPDPEFVTVGDRGQQPMTVPIPPGKENLRINLIVTPAPKH